MSRSKKSTNTTTKRTKYIPALEALEKRLGGPLTIAGMLNAIRLGEELSYTEFAEKIGISRSHLCDIEKGRKAVSLDRAIHFADTLGYSTHQFAELALQSQINSAGLKMRVKIEAA